MTNTDSISLQSSSVPTTTQGPNLALHLQKKVLLKQSFIHLKKNIYDSFHTTVAELSGCDRWYGLQSQKYCYPGLHRECLLLLPIHTENCVCCCLYIYPHIFRDLNVRLIGPMTFATTWFKPCHFQYAHYKQCWSQGLLYSS